MTESKLEKICVDVLSDALKTPITGPKQSYYILERLSLCFVSVARDVKLMAEELYGNGTPGGIKAQVITLLESYESIERKLDALVDKMHSLDIKDAKSHDGSFDSLLKWFVDKVLPSVVSTMVMAIMFGLALLTVFMSGLVTIQIP